MSVPSENGETRELIVVPPLGAAYDDPEYHRRIEAALEREFPDFHFMVMIEAPHRYDSFTIIPVLGVANSTDEVDGLLRAPSVATLRDLAIFLDDFMIPSHSRRH